MDSAPTSKTSFLKMTCKLSLPSRKSSCRADMAPRSRPQCDAGHARLSREAYLRRRRALIVTVSLKMSLFPSRPPHAPFEP